MKTAFGSHTMPSLGDVLGEAGPFLLGAAALLAAVPLLLVAGSRGAKSAARLPLARHVLATSAGAALGLLALVGVAGGLLATIPRGWGVLLGVPLGGSVGALVAHRTARALGERVSWYRCAVCGAPFRFWRASGCCPACDAQHDREEVSKALAGFDERYRRMP
jgi:hypothetical protein